MTSSFKIPAMTLRVPPELAASVTNSRDRPLPRQRLKAGERRVPLAMPPCSTLRRLAPGHWRVGSQFPGNGTDRGSEHLLALHCATLQPTDPPGRPPKHRLAFPRPRRGVTAPPSRAWTEKVASPL